MKFIADDDPVIQSSIEEAFEVPIPNMGFNFLSQYQFKIDCTYLTLDEKQHLCNDTVIQPKYLEYNGHPGSYGYFMNKNNLNFTKLTGPNGPNANAITGILITISSPMISTDNLFDMSTIQFFAIDTEKSPIDLEKFVITNDTAFSELPRYVGESITDNSFILPNKQQLNVRLNRRIRKTIHSKFTGTLGINPSYDVQPYLRSNLQSMPFPPEVNIPAGMFLGQIIFTFQNFLVTVETEQSLAAALYASLFGVDMIRPWGCVQLYCCNLSRFHNKLKQTLPTIPLVDPSPSQDVKVLQDRLSALEIFLKEYVIDVKHLENIKKIGDDYKGLPPIPNIIPMNRNQRELPPIPNQSSVYYSQPSSNIPEFTIGNTFSASSSQYHGSSVVNPGTQANY
ncbi:19869_t:CDS:2 [Funneliformis geosporum]|uniref:3620_t:CDS:1 n=1 Tax=Funneliformis geosporum TaxID=1117311 RepID=A0A9W4SKM6_9GLOM|nr:3620_t:CDS:2 [Funneliformis geosporum]CAI2178343.1 19869_t:CDS:2 [Funneliformis geosporum]